MAVRMGVVDIKEILNLTAKKFLEWEAYSILEPFDDTRADYRSASIATVIANVNRGTNQRAYKLDDFLLKFGVQEVALAGQPKSVSQTPEQQEAMMRILMGVPVENTV